MVRREQTRWQFSIEMKSLIQFIEFILLPVIGITSRNIATNSQDLFNIFSFIVISN